MLLESNSPKAFFLVFIAIKSVCHVRQQRHLARSLDSCHHLTLMRRAYACRAARQNLAALRHKAAKLHRILVIYVSRLIDAKLTYFAAALTRPAGVFTIFGHF